jgi:hypothetical protein
LIDLTHGDFLLIDEKFLFQFVQSSSEFALNPRLFQSAVSNRSDEASNEAEALNEKLFKYENLIDEQRKQIQRMNEQIELNNSQMSKLKEFEHSVEVSHSDEVTTNVSNNHLMELKPIIQKTEIYDLNKLNSSMTNEQEEEMIDMIEKFEVSVDVFFSFYFSFWRS